MMISEDMEMKHTDKLLSVAPWTSLDLGCSHSNEHNETKKMKNDEMNRQQYWNRRNKDDK